jgi:hypothetical protein
MSACRLKGFSGLFFVYGMLLNSNNHEIWLSNAKHWLISNFMLSDGLGLIHLQTGNINELKVIPKYK